MGLLGGTFAGPSVQRFSDNQSADGKTIWQRLFDQGIYTKSMLKTYLRCPEDFYQQYVLGREQAPSWFTSLGKSMHDLLELWGQRLLVGNKRVDPKEARQLLSDGWDNHMQDVEIPEGERKDAKLKVFVQLFDTFRTAYRRERLGKLEAVEQAYGYDGKLMLGRVPIAGHADQVWTRGIVDAKVVKHTSKYRKPDPFDIELVMYSIMSGKKWAALMPMVHTLKTPKVEYIGREITPLQVEVVTASVESIVDAINAGNFPRTVEKIGQYPCTEKWCDWFGTCRLTKGVTTKDLRI